MSVGNKLLQAAAGNAGEVVYVDDVFSTHLYKGSNGSQTITNNIDLSGEGGMVVLKGRDASSGEAWITTDTERGTGKYLMWHNTDAQSTTADVAVQSFTSSGFGLTGSESSTNNGALTYVSYTFRKQSKFFDVVTWTGNSTSGRTVSHNLGSVPGMIIVKRTDSTGAWQVYHRANTANPETDYLVLNTDAGTNDSLSRWNDTAPTSTEFTLGNSATVNYSGGTYVAYLFAHDEQEFGENSDEAIIKCGSYTGNGTGASSTQHIDLGFEPQFFLVKVTNINGQAWFLVDTMRGFANNGNDSNDVRLMPNETDSEFGYQVGHPTATGIQLNGNENEINANNNTYVYMAIARPHKPASEFAATDLFAIDTKGGTTPNPPLFTAGFPVDMAFNKNTGGNGNWRNVARLMQGKSLIPNNNNDEDSDGSLGAFDYQNGWRDGTTVTASAYAWMWRRAKGYFDVVINKGAGGGYTTINHNLGVAPELAIAKVRDYTPGQEWYIWVPSEGVEKAFNFDNGAIETHPYLKNFTSTTMDTNLGGGVYTYIYYLFASVDGISKVGSYSGTGSDVTVDCGFSAGARFVLIKRSDSTGDWYLYDSSRGIVAGDDPYILLNSNAAGVSNTDYIDPDNSGFIVTSSAPAALNNSGGSYIFYAIA